MLTPGEYIVNAQSTKANRGLLEQINAGKEEKLNLFTEEKEEVMSPSLIILEGGKNG